MSSHASTRITSTSYGPGSFSPYMLEEDLDKPQALSPVIPRVEKHTAGGGRQPPGLNFYRSISWILGFRDKYSLLNCFVWGGALVGFCLARSVTMNPNPSKIAAQLIPGEWFWFQQPMYKINLFIHIYLTTIGGIMVLLQFFPAMRRRAVILHRLNGYGVLFCLIVGNICGGIVARRSFGGELNAQSAYYILAIMIAYTGLLGIYNVKKDTRRHRKWMLRMVSYFASIITARLMMLAAREIITIIGTYYSIWRCDEILNLLDDPQAIQNSFPQCVAAGANPASIWLAVHASTHDGPLYAASSVRATQGSLSFLAVLNRYI
ncbi:hypothetical protein B0H13DRAFT_1997740 [Mycena leptocephala]|nr:hypothetical protein B0H13DRAFT_1997740 [Mycena leptocephala]